MECKVGAELRFGHGWRKKWLVESRPLANCPKGSTELAVRQASGRVRGHCLVPCYSQLGRCSFAVTKRLGKPLACHETCRDLLNTHDDATSLCASGVSRACLP